MRILDADILSYALFDESPAHRDSWNMIENALKTQISLYVTMTSILETYNVLYWFYRVRPRIALIQKISTHGYDDNRRALPQWCRLGATREHPIRRRLSASDRSQQQNPGNCIERHTHSNGSTQSRPDHRESSFREDETKVVG